MSAGSSSRAQFETPLVVVVETGQGERENGVSVGVRVNYGV